MTPVKARTYLSDAEQARLLRVPVPAPVTPDTLLAFRRRHHLRIVDLARFLGIDEQTVRRIERGRPTYNTPQFGLFYGTTIALALCEIERRLEDTP